MKRLRFPVFILAIGMMLVTPPTPASAQVYDIYKIIKDAVKKVMRAVDLAIQRLQNETIALQNAAKVIENELSKLKLAEIAEWTEKQRSLYQKYFDDLWKIRNTLATFQRVRQVLDRQQQIVATYQRTWSVMRNDSHFTRVEIDYMYRVYTGIFNESVKNLDQLLLVVSSFKTQMTDAKRLEIINEVGSKVDQNYSDLVQFNNQNIMLSVNRAKDEHEIKTTKKLYGLPN